MHPLFRGGSRLCKTFHSSCRSCPHTDDPTAGRPRMSDFFSRRLGYRKNRVIAVSIKSKDVEEERTAVRDHRKNEADRPAATTIGDLIKAQMDQDRS